MGLYINKVVGTVLIFKPMIFKNINKIKILELFIDKRPSGSVN